jgi:hypothetical protein
MWLRRLLVGLYGLEERSAHTPDEVNWEALSRDCVLQLHWPRTRAFRRALDRNGFRVIALARHPFDVLLSILHFAGYEPQTARWLDGAEGDEDAIIGTDPCSQAFRDYAVSPRARVLIDVSRQWWGKGLASVRYEDLVVEPEQTLGLLLSEIAATPLLPIRRVLDEVTFESLQKEAVNGHFWQGNPGHWRELLPPDVVDDITAPYAKLLETSGYDGEPNPMLTREAAQRQWRRISRAGRLQSVHLLDGAA